MPNTRVELKLFNVKTYLKFVTLCVIKTFQWFCYWKVSSRLEAEENSFGQFAPSSAILESTAASRMNFWAVNSNQWLIRTAIGANEPIENFEWQFTPRIDLQLPPNKTLKTTGNWKLLIALSFLSARPSVFRFNWIVGWILIWLVFFNNIITRSTRFAYQSIGLLANSLVANLPSRRSVSTWVGGLSKG